MGLGARYLFRLRGQVLVPPRSPSLERYPLARPAPTVEREEDRNQGQRLLCGGVNGHVAPKDRERRSGI